MMKDPKDGRPIYNVGAEYDRGLSDEEAAKVQDIVAVCSVVLRGNAPRLVGAVLADLVSLWLAGHVPTDERGRAGDLHGIATHAQSHVGVARWVGYGVFAAQPYPDSRPKRLPARPDHAHRQGRQRHKGAAMKRFESVIVGMRFQRDAYVTLATLSAGDTVTLRRERKNEHDRNAVAVWFGASKLGYAPRASNAAMAAAMDNAKIEVAPARLLMSGNPNARPAIEPRFEVTL
jgi:hypothetical protein